MTYGNHDDERSRQMEHGRRSTLSVPEGRRNSYPSGSSGKKPASLASGHDKLLKALVGMSAEIEVRLMSTDQIVRGVLKHSDKFTLTVYTQEEGDVVYFKHDISSFRSLTPKND